MLVEVKELHGTTIHAKDGEVGKVDEILFDDVQWTVRYLIVDTGHWLSSRKVLLSPMSFGALDWPGKILNVNLTREQIKNSPGVDTDEPVSRQWETEYYGYYGWPYYWGGIGGVGGMSGMGGWGSYWYPAALLAHPYGNDDDTQLKEVDAGLDQAQTHNNFDTELRSTKEVTGYGISATDGHIGHIADFIVDDGTWRIRYLAVDTRDWWPGKKVLLPPDWIGNVSWPDGSVTVNVTQEQVKNAPEWNRDKPIDSAFEEQLYRYYSRAEDISLIVPESYRAVNAEHADSSESVKLAARANVADSAKPHPGRRNRIAMENVDVPVPPLLPPLPTLNKPHFYGHEAVMAPGATGYTYDELGAVIPDRLPKERKASGGGSADRVMAIEEEEEKEKEEEEEEEEATISVTTSSAVNDADVKKIIEEFDGRIIGQSH